MARTRLQKGPATDHYHVALGVDQTPGGGVTVDNQTDPPAEVTTLIAPGATISGSEADFSAISGVQRIRLLGPYSWTWDGPAFEGSGDTLFNLSSGQILLAAWCLVDTAFNPETDPLASVVLSIGNTSIRGWQTTNASTAGNASEGVLTARLAGTGVDSLFGEFDLPAMFGGTGAPVKIRGYYEGAGPLTQGEGRIYALIAEPA